MKWVFGTFKGIAQHIIATWFEGFGGGGQVVSVLAFYSDNPSSNPAEVNNFNLYNEQKRSRGWPHFKNKYENFWRKFANILATLTNFFNAFKYLFSIW